MKNRTLEKSIAQYCFAQNKIALLSGPRQCGKTTLAKAFLKQRDAGQYYNWDAVEFRRLWTKTPSALLPAAKSKQTPLLVLDEIHKDRFWKRTLKGMYDTLIAPCDIFVTGSARLNIYRRGGDSLLGRYLHFRLHPFSLREMERDDAPGPEETLQNLFGHTMRPSPAAKKHLDDLLAYGPFPEPLFRQDRRMANLWRQNREQIIIREDLRDLSRLPDLARVELMATLLPDRVGSLFSVANMREDLEVRFDTVQRWLEYLKEIYYVFEIKPYAAKIRRSLKREGKVYLWDYSGLRDEGIRFENLVAAHLLKACHYWSDTGEGNFELYFLRDKEKHEIDFLIVRDRIPWLPVEVKLSDTTPSPHWKKFASQLPCQRGLQITRTPGWKLHTFGDSKILVAGAAEALRYFV